MAKGIFKDLKVIELASVLAGPSVGQFFAELGAEVIKVENPKTGGDVTRSWYLPAEERGSVSAYFSCVNWGKKSVMLDITEPMQREQLYRLIQDADIVISSYKPGDDEKLGVDYEYVRKINPAIIYGQITGYGALADRVGYDAIIQAEAGFMSINGEADSLPLKMPVALMDLLAGHQLKEALLIGYINLLKTGKGSFYTVSLIEAGLTSLANQATNYLIAGHQPKQKGSLHPNIAPYGEILQLPDGRMLMLAIGSDKQFRALCNILHMKQDERFTANSDRVKHRRQLLSLLQSAVDSVNPSDFISALERNHIPAGVIQSVPEAIQLYAAHIGLYDGDRLIGLRTYVANSASRENDSHLLPPPSPGEHNEDILPKN